MAIGVPIVGVRVVVMVLGIPVRVELAFVVVGSPNAGVGLVGTMLGVSIRIGLAAVVRSPNADVGPAYPLCVVLGDSVRGGLPCVVLGLQTLAVG